MYHWAYFELKTLAGNKMNLVDEEGCTLNENGRPVVFKSAQEADEYLKQNDIRGTITNMSGGSTK